uniref:Putative secreted protein n=1 Tax=Anopheles darlingi TaxID=43151 RepID=A0A2M4D0V6_ANODA
MWMLVLMLMLLMLLMLLMVLVLLLRLLLVLLRLLVLLMRHTGGCGSGKLMLLCRWMLRNVHHMQVLLMMVLLRGRSHVLVDSRHNLGDRANWNRVRCRLLMMNLGVRWRTTTGRRWLWARVVLLVRLTW